MELSDNTIYALIIFFIICCGCAIYNYWFSSPMEAEITQSDVWICPKCKYENHDDISIDDFICAGCNTFFFWEEINWSDTGIRTT